MSFDAFHHGQQSSCPRSRQRLRLGVPYESVKRVQAVYIKSDLLDLEVE